MRHLKAQFYLLSLLSVFFWLNEASALDDRQEIDSTNAIPYEYMVSHLRKSIDSLTANVEKARLIHYEYGEAKALAKLGIAYYLNGKYDESTDCHVQAIRIFEEIKAVAELADIYGVFGYQLKRRDLPKANHYMRLAIAVAEKNGFKKKLTAQYGNYGVLKEMESNPDSAMYFYKKALSLQRELSDSTGIPYRLNSVAGIYAMRGEFSKALEFARLSDEYRNREQGDFGRAQNLVLYAEIYAMQGKGDFGHRHI